MKIYRFFSSALCLLFLCLLLSGCRDLEPVKLVKSELNQIKNLDEQTIRTFISYKDLVHINMDDDSCEEATEAIRLFFKDFDYRILSSSISDDTATVNVEIQHLDALALAKDLCLEMIASSSSPSPKETVPASTASYFSLLRDILSSHTYDTVHTTAHFNLTKAKEQWTIQSNETLENDLVGGFISFLHDPYLVTPEEIAAKVFENLRVQTAQDWIACLDMNDIFATYSTIYDKADFALARQISKCFSYKIQKITENGDQATAVVDVTSLDMDSILDDYLDKLLDYASTTEAIRATDTELADKTASLLVECLNSNTKTCTTTIEVEFTNNGTAWEMKLNSAFTDAVLGDITKAIETFQNAALAS